jgi:hypothetical protein
MTIAKPVLRALELIGLQPHAEDDGTIVALCPVCDNPGASLAVKTTDPPALRCALGCSAALVREAVSALAVGHLDAEPEPSAALAVLLCECARAAAPPPVARMRRLSDVEAREVEWLWPGRIPAGMVAMLDGPPGCGKSTLVADLVARLTTGRALPAEAADTPRPPANVILLGHEDSAAHTIRPRLEAAGADLRRVHLLEELRGQPPRLPDDGAEIERIVGETEARLLVIDPISAYIGRADTHRDNETRAALAPLATLAERTGCVVLMLRHLRKSGGTDAIYRGLGSVAFTALARASLMLLVDPEDPAARILAWSKLNVGPIPPSLRWRWEDGEGAPRIKWEGTSPLSADDVLCRHEERLRSGEGRASALDAAADWLMAQFESADTVPVKELQARASRAGLAWRTIERAKGRLGARAGKVSGTAGAAHWVWSAPTMRAPGGRAAGKAAETPHLAVLPAGVPSGSRKSAPEQDLCGEPKAATPKPANLELADLDADDIARSEPGCCVRGGR